MAEKTIDIDPMSGSLIMAKDTSSGKMLMF